MTPVNLYFNHNNYDLLLIKNINISSPKQFRLVHFFPDVPHLIKLIRNHLLDEGNFFLHALHFVLTFEENLPKNFKHTEHSDK